jgi:hypothetical protein
MARPASALPANGAFAADVLIADDSDHVDSVKRGLRQAVMRLCELEWDALLLVHGLPLLENAKVELRSFAAD